MTSTDQMRVWLAEVCAVSDTSLSEFLTDSLSSLLHSQGAGHAPLSLLLLLSVDAQLSGLQW